MGTLTVRENLYFSAALRLPLSMPWSEKKRRVEKTINELGLSACADTKVRGTLSYTKLHVSVHFICTKQSVHVHI